MTSEASEATGGELGLVGHRRAVGVLRAAGAAKAGRSAPCAPPPTLGTGTASPARLRQHLVVVWARARSARAEHQRVAREGTRLQAAQRERVASVALVPRLGRLLGRHGGADLARGRRAALAPADPLRGDRRDPQSRRPSTPRASPSPSPSAPSTSAPWAASRWPGRCSRPRGTRSGRRSGATRAPIPGVSRRRGSSRAASRAPPWAPTGRAPAAARA